MNWEDKIELAVTCGLSGFLLFWYLLFFILFAKSSKTQMVKSKAPKLLLMSTIGNFLSFLIITITLVLITLKNELTIEEKKLKNIANMGLVLAEVIFAPLMFYSHMFRIIQLKNILKIDDDAIKHLPTKSKWFRQGVYFIMDLILFAMTIGLGGWLMMNWLDSNTLFPPFLTTILMSLNFLFILPVSAFGVALISNVKCFTGIHTELTSLIIIWTVTNGAFNCLIICFDADINIRLQAISIPLIILLVRNMLTFIIVLVIPLLDRNKEKVIPFGETRASISSLETILASELCFKYFFDFIADLDKLNGANVTALYIQMKLFEEAVNDNLNVQLGKEKIKEIINDFLTEDGKNWINDMPKEIKIDIERRMESERFDTRFFNGLYNNILPRLQKYFEEFEKAVLYKRLIKVLEHNEIVYERLVNGNLI